VNDIIIGIRNSFV